MRSALLDLTPVIPVTACHQRNYVETYSRYSLRGHKQEEPLRMAGRFTLREGQTILGVMDTPELMCFCLGKSEEHVHQEEDTGP